METKQYTLTGVWRNTTDKAGNPLKSKDGKPYTKVSIKTKETGDKYVGGFGNKANAEWKVGDVVDIIVEQNGEYLNFKIPSKDDELTDRLSKLEARVMRLELSEERRFEELKAKLKGEIVLETTGKFMTDKDLKDYNDNAKDFMNRLTSNNPLDGIPMEDIPF